MGFILEEGLLREPARGYSSFGGVLLARNGVGLVVAKNRGNSSHVDEELGIYQDIDTGEVWVNTPEGSQALSNLTGADQRARKWGNFQPLSFIVLTLGLVPWKGATYSGSHNFLDAAGAYHVNGDRMDFRVTNLIYPSKAEIALIERYHESLIGVAWCGCVSSERKREILEPIGYLRVDYGLKRRARV